MGGQGRLEDPVVNFSEQGGANSEWVALRLLRGSSIVALAALSLCFGSPARAGCEGDFSQPNKDNVITCTGTDSNPYVLQPDDLENGADTINLISGTGNGSISGGGGPDRFKLEGATVNGTLIGGESSNRAAQPQPEHIDTFNLNSGVINAPASGDAIIAERGDDIIKIGGVTINGNVSGGRGADTITMTGGTVNGSISGEGTLGVEGSGPSDDDTIIISGGTVTGAVSGNDENDNITWSGGFVGAINGNDGTDLATFRNLTPANLTPSVRVDGGLGFDHLVWDHTIGGVVGRYVNWELFELTQGSQLTFSSTLTLGDAGTGTGTLTIDPTSTVFAGAGDHEIVPFTAGQLVTVTNAGTIDLTDGNATDSLRIVGNYAGQSGTGRLDTVLASDGAPSDLLIIDGGAATGSTRLFFTDAGGGGALTTGDGILVVDAVNGGTTAPRAFSGFAAAGPYEYRLFRGGTGSTEDWFLRNTLQPIPPEPLPEPGPGPGPGPTPAPGSGPGPNPEPPAPPGPPTPRYRQEVSLYDAMPVMAAIYGRKIIDTLHERMGGDAQLLGPGKEDMPDGAWGRVIGYWGHRDGDPIGIYGRSGPEFDYNFGAIQAGLDLYRSEYANGQRDNAGLYFAIGRAHADVDHNILGVRFKGGEDDFDAVSVGGYWTRFGKNDWYLDGVVQGTWYDMDMTARRGLRDGDTNGFGFAASLEGGYPFQLGGGWKLEPQAQLVYQALNIDDFNDGAADVRYSDTNSLAGRIGARVTQDWDVGGEASKRKFTLWGRADLWHEFLGDPTTAFSSATGFIPFTADLGDDWATLGIGAAIQVADAATLYGNVNYDTSFDGDADAWEGKVGLKIQW
jgi:outer membrane autotransporter protein